MSENDAIDQSPHSWAAGLSGRRVDFQDSIGLVSWGIEIDLPIDKREKDRLKRLSFAIPPRVKSIKFLDLAPQESLLRNQRTIRTNKPWFIPTHFTALSESTVSHPIIEKITSATKTERWSDINRRWQIELLFQSLFGNNQIKKKEFNSLLAEGSGTEIVIVTGHGDKDPWKIGEQYDDTVQDATGKFLQRTGNNVPIHEILSHYNVPIKYAAILLVACYSGNTSLSPIDIPIVRGKGNINSYNVAFANPQTEIVHPRVR